MINTVKTSAYFRDPPEQRQGQHHPEGEEQPSNGGASSEPQTDVRLLIEHNEEADSLTYKLVDRTTGKLLAEISREDMIRLGDAPTYAAGSLIDTKA